MKHILCMLMLCIPSLSSFAESSKTTGVDLNVGYPSGNEIAPITQQSKKYPAL
ncbi:MAG: hypothetical protein LIP05_06145 [Tannerellaceae bacterium]|nr:hypothetical protein [Tannerellaceae bacterium]